jgi:ABC-type nitrate/sulfonate/bicarbonate transport system substrate-binding protein
MCLRQISHALSAWVLVVLALYIAGACSVPTRSPAGDIGSPVSAGVVPPPVKRDVRLAYVSTAISFSPLWAAQEYGLLEQYGLHSDDLFYISGGPAIMQALVAGDLDAAYSAFSPVVAAIMSGASAKIVAGYQRGFVHQLFTKEDTGIRSAQDMRGKRVGVSRIGAESQVVVQIWARANGLREDDIIYVNAGGAAERLAALDVGSVDLVPLDPLEVVLAQKRGYLLVADMTQQPVPWQSTGLTVRENTLRSDPALVKALVQAVSEGAYLLRSDPERFQAVVSKYTRVEDPEALAIAYTSWKRAVTPHGRPDPAGVAMVQQVIDQSLPGTAQEPVARFVDYTVLEQLEREGFFDQLERRYPPS